MTLINLAKPSAFPDYSGFDQSLMDTSSSIDAAAFLDNTSPSGELVAADAENDFAGFVLIDRGSFLSVTSPTSDVAPTSKGKLLVYKVVAGDNLSTIAAKFGISVNTIVWANNLKGSNFVKLGQEIVILPVSGVLHDVKAGETIGSIAALYGVTPEQIATFNKNKIVEGDTVVVPNAKPKTAKVVSTLPDAGDYLAFPIKDGWNWGQLHDGGAVDISDSCGTPIFASAEGLVTEVGSTANWNGGFGGFVRIKHPLNNIETMYSHTSVNLVSVGDYVTRGETIAKIGKTGKVTGPTGCHVHFVVFGAQNPFVKK
jgi:murein DD-endopeptidase MepM/ murein hydrolase activator NlpD